MRILTIFPSLGLALLLCLSCGDDSVPTPTPHNPSPRDPDANTSGGSADGRPSPSGSDAARPAARDGGLDAARTSEPQDGSRDGADAADTGSPSEGSDSSLRDTGDAAVDAMSHTPAHDSGAADAAPVDAGPVDAGAADAAPVDAGAADAAPVDTGADAGAADAGAADAGPVDAGPVDAGPMVAESPWCGRIRCDCTLSGIPLHGRVRVVQNLADFKVRETSFPDLRVNESPFTDRCGEWEFVDALEDFKIQWVTALEDFSIEYSSFPGVVKSAN